MGIIKNIIRRTYSVRMRLSKLTGMGISIIDNNKKVKPLQSFYNLEAKTNNGEIISFESYRGKKVLLVNLASKCGYTPQYLELEELFQLKKNELVILGFPSNNFGEQEPGTDDEIAQFCKINFGVTFPVFLKDNVTGKDKQPAYQWLTDERKNGWNNKEPSWNFCKYLVDENGNLLNMYSASVSPLHIIE